MSNHLAIATVTATFARLLTAAAQTAVEQATVRFGAPDATSGQDGKPLVNLFLYQVSPDTQRRNAFMPTRRRNGQPAGRTRVALDLRYVVSFYGDAAKFEPERMMGAVAVAVEDQPIFSPELVQKAVADNPSVLNGSDLEKALSTVRLTPESLSLDDLSKMWSIFFQVPYAPSVAYLCSHVSIETGDDAQPALPVAIPRVFPAPMARTAIDEVRAATGATAPIVWGGKLSIRGRRLNAPGLTLRIGSHDVAIGAGDATAAAIDLDLEAALLGGDELPAGFHTVQAVLPPPPGAPAHLSRATAARVFALQPVITVEQVTLAATSSAESADGTLEIGFSPAIVEGQTVRLLLDQRVTHDPQAVTLEPEPVAPGDFPAQQVEFTFSGLRRSTFLVRAQLDGVDSVPQIDLTAGSATFGEIVGPEADLT